MFILPAIILYIIFFLPFITTFPYLDGNAEFLISFNFYQGNYLTHWREFHPPLKLILSDGIFHVFGLSAYNTLGYFLGIVGIIAIYYAAQALFDRTTAVISSLLLACSGLYLANSLFALNDFILSICILTSFAYYVKKKYLFATLATCCAILTKETAIFWAISILLIEIFRKKWKPINLLPIFTLIGWITFLHLTKHHMWNSWNLSPTAKQGGAYTILSNLLTGAIFNKYAYENWLHLFVFNFNWLFWLLALSALRKTKWNDNFSIAALFTAFYTVLILSFQTFAIPRYVLPILPFVYILTAFQLRKTKYKPIIIPIVVLCALISLFTSSDPISNHLWKRTQILAISPQKFYANPQIDGNDGITYNMQFMLLAKKRSDIIKSRQCGKYKNQIVMNYEVEETMTALQLPPCQ